MTLDETTAAPPPDLAAALQKANAACLRLGLSAAPAADPWRLIASFCDSVSALQQRSEDAAAAEVLLHLAYLADKAGVGITALTDATPRDVHNIVLYEAVLNIEAVLSKVPIKPPAEACVPFLPEEVLAVIEKAELQLDGWCSREKSVAIVRALIEHRPEVCVEIGVFGGRSAIPCAATLRHLGSGSLYAIESWSNTTAIEHVTNEANDAWWATVDLSRIKTNFMRFVVEQDLAAQIRIIEAPSASAATLFDRIDFLHIDGAHSVVNAAEDVILYAQKVRRGGVIIFDDVGWETTAPAMEILKALCEPPSIVTDPNTGVPMFAMMRRR